MRLSKQLVAAFSVVAILPLLLVSIYLFGTNMQLAFDLYGKNMQNAADIQANLLEENLNRMMVRASRFSSSAAVRETCESGLVGASISPQLSTELLNFTEETLDSISIFALVNLDREILYASGSISDSRALSRSLVDLAWPTTQQVLEIPLGERVSNLTILTPVMQGNEQIGLFLVAFRTDYFLKMMSSHRQIGNSNAFLFSVQHQVPVVSKQEFSSIPPALIEQTLLSETGKLLCELDGVPSLLSFRHFRKTPWIFVSSLPVRDIIALSLNYILISVPLLLAMILLILFLSGRQSKKIVRPLNQLLGAVERFFRTGSDEFSSLSLDPKSEIGYLANQFVEMSDGIAQAQQNLHESNYLYSALLAATYELRVVISLQSGTLQIPPTFSKELVRFDAPTQRDQLLQFMSGDDTDYPHKQPLLLADILFGRVHQPSEVEVCCRMQQETDPRWYRVIAVPITDTKNPDGRMVLHFEDISLKKQEELRLIRSAQTDPLCGLLNKSAFLSLCQMSAPAAQAAMFFIDLDHFKQVNDLFGHSAGDDVLISTAKQLQALFRGCDLVGRYGGDEFVVYSPNITEDKAREKAEQLVSLLAFSFGDSTENALLVTASVGVFLLHGRADFTQAVRRADEAMYHAKQNGKSQYFFSK